MTEQHDTNEFEFRLSPDRRQFAIWEPGNEPWFAPEAAMQGRWITSADMDRLRWTRYVPVADLDKPAAPGIGYEFRESLGVLLSRVQRGVQSDAEADLLRSHIEHLLSEHDRLAALAVPKESTTLTVEQMAHALAAAAAINPQRTATHWDHLSPAERGQYREQARRVITPVADEQPAEPHDTCICPPTHAGLTLCARCPGNTPKEPRS